MSVNQWSVRTYIHTCIHTEGMIINSSELDKTQDVRVPDFVLDHVSQMFIGQFVHLLDRSQVSRRFTNPTLRLDPERDRRFRV